ncbi:MAG: 50S ribosomal protein L30 [Candidatus Diapherotrites archaeon]|uniref:Large ribosomal subunit protein uL30 n=1 Tax=Candidatus Iainarchaeum sp. TaxID=3101447 RepID=A0A2D6LP87_9ARCH|nr:50S ribosomal protein L30 [Candidatus Diapherotrites archaeon]|tara:strand:+ start:6428 stop:6889 length:462 start_codon:yes stop_codon:yes gene_type:complete
MIAVIRIRGTVNVNPGLTYTMENLRLFRPNHMVLLKDDKSSKKMIEKIKDYVAFGEINEETLAKVLIKRGKLEGKKKVTLEFLKEKKINSFEELAKSIIEGKVKFKDLGIVPVIRLHPPRKGHKRAGIKKPFTVGGALGNRGEEINKLIVKMN